MRRVVFFDGECGFCQRSARWLARFDRECRIDFATLQGELAAKLGFSSFAQPRGGSLVVWRDDGSATFISSEALFEICRALGGGWRFLEIFRPVPRVLRDAVYRWVARNRYRFGGGEPSAILPDEEFARRLRR